MFRPTTTNIDRRKCHRTVPLEVMCFGLSRTGTHSLRAALMQLGYKDTYHAFETALENPRDAEMWIDAFETKFAGKHTFQPDDWDKLLGHCMATTDSPTIFFWQELMAKYPDRKIILTVRDTPEQYYRSVMNTLYQHFVRYQLPTWNPWRLVYRALCKDTSPYMRMNYLESRYGGYRTFAEDGIARYLEHNEKVKQAVPKDRLLVFNVKEGWEPLCKFLGKEIPDTPFPKGNDTAFTNSIIHQTFATTDAIVRRKLLWIMAFVVAMGAVTHPATRSSVLRAITATNRRLRF